MSRTEDREPIAGGEDSKVTHSGTAANLLEQDDPFLFGLWKTRPDADRTTDT